jgi:DHA1 family multidrug resistance protein-like MFS transporter
MQRRGYTVLFMAVFASTMGVGFIGPLLPLYARDLGASGLELGMIFSGYALARFILTPFIGRSSDRRGRKVFLAVGLALYSGFSLLYIWASTAGQLILVRSLHGASAGLVIPVAQAYIGDISPPGKESSFMGTFTVSTFAAFGIGPLVGGPLADRFGMTAPFYVMGVLSAVALLLVLLFLPEQGLHRERWEKRAPVRSVLGHGVVIALLVFRITVAFGRGVIVPFLPLLAQARGASISVTGLLLATHILLAGFLQIPFGRLADRVSKPLLMTLSMLGSAIVILAIPYCRTITHLFFLQVMTGIVSALGFPAAIGMAAKAGRKFCGMGTVMSLFNSGMSIGLILGPLGGGFFEGIFGLDFVFMGGSLVMATGLAVFLVLMRNARENGSLAAILKIGEPEATGGFSEEVGIATARK